MSSVEHIADAVRHVSRFSEACCQIQLYVSVQINP